MGSKRILRTSIGASMWIFVMLGAMTFSDGIRAEDELASLCAAQLGSVPAFHQKLDPVLRHIVTSGGWLGAPLRVWVTANVDREEWGDWLRLLRFQGVVIFQQGFTSAAELQSYQGRARAEMTLSFGQILDVVKQNLFIENIAISTANRGF